MNADLMLLVAGNMARSSLGLDWPLEGLIIRTRVGRRGIRAARRKIGTPLPASLIHQREPRGLARPQHFPRIFYAFPKGHRIERRTQHPK